MTTTQRFATYLAKEEEAWFCTREAERLERFEDTYKTVRENARTSAQAAAEHAARDSHLKRTPAPIDLHWYEGQARKLDFKDPAERLEAAVVRADDKTQVGRYQLLYAVAEHAAPENASGPSTIKTVWKIDTVTGQVWQLVSLGIALLGIECLRRRFRMA
jgi:hypothetical protein